MQQTAFGSTLSSSATTSAWPPQTRLSGSKVSSAEASVVAPAGACEGTGRCRRLFPIWRLSCPFRFRCSWTWLSCWLFGLPFETAFRNRYGWTFRSVSHRNVLGACGALHKPFNSAEVHLREITYCFGIGGLIQFNTSSPTSDLFNVVCW